MPLIKIAHALPNSRESYRDELQDALAKARAHLGLALEIDSGQHHPGLHLPPAVVLSALNELAKMPLDFDLSPLDLCRNFLTQNFDEGWLFSEYPAITIPVGLDSEGYHRLLKIFASEVGRFRAHRAAMLASTKLSPSMLLFDGAVFMRDPNRFQMAKQIFDTFLESGLDLSYLENALIKISDRSEVRRGDLSVHFVDWRSTTSDLKNRFGP